MFRIDSAKCTGCGTCLDVCPQGAISLRGDKAEIDRRLCVECGMCLDVCAAGAVYEVAEVPQGAGTYERLVINQKGKEVSRMRGRGFGRGWFGGGWGNPYPYCRFYPWLPRRWWATPHAGYYGATAPHLRHGYPYYGVAGASYYTPYRAWPWY